jgi:hypothetical protein
MRTTPSRTHARAHARYLDEDGLFEMIKTFPAQKGGAPPPAKPAKKETKPPAVPVPEDNSPSKAQGQGASAEVTSPSSTAKSSNPYAKSLAAEKLRKQSSSEAAASSATPSLSSSTSSGGPAEEK